MNNNRLVFLRACGKLAVFFWLSLKHWTDLHKIFKMHLALLGTVVYPSSFLFFSLGLSFPPKSLDTLLHPGFLHLPFVDSFHILSHFLPAVVFWELPLSSLVFASVDGDCFFRSLGENNKIQSKEPGLWANNMTEVAVHVATTLPNNF